MTMMINKLSIGNRTLERMGRIVTFMIQNLKERILNNTLSGRENPDFTPFDPIEYFPRSYLSFIAGPIAKRRLNESHLDRIRSWNHQSLSALACGVRHA